MKITDVAFDARQPGLAYCIGVLDAAARFRVTVRRRMFTAATPTDLLVEVRCDEDVAGVLINVFGGEWNPNQRPGWRGKWKLRQHEITNCLEIAIPLMRNARRVREAQAVLACRMTKGKSGPQISDATRRARIDATAAGGLG